MTEETKDFEALYLEAKARIRELERQMDACYDQIVGKDKQLAAMSGTLHEYRADVSRVNEEFESHKRLSRDALLGGYEALARERKTHEEEILLVKSEEKQARADLIFERDNLRETVIRLNAMLTDEQRKSADLPDIERITSGLKTDLVKSREANAVLQKELGVLARSIAEIQNRLEAQP